MQKADLNRNKEKLMSDVNERGEERHRVIDNIIKILKSDIDKTESKHLAVLQRHEDEINQSTLEITQRIGELNKLLDYNDVCILSRYKSRNAELRKLPPILNFLTKLLFSENRHRTSNSTVWFSVRAIHYKRGASLHKNVP